MEQEHNYSETKMAMRVAVSMVRMTAYLLVPAIISSLIAKRIAETKSVQLGIIFIGFVFSWCCIYLDYKFLLKKKRK